MREKHLNKIMTAAFLFVALCVSTACRRSSPTDLRQFAPRETILYLETNDVAALLESLTERPAFQTLAARQPDFSSLVDVQAAIIMTNFETSEENAVLNFKPRFVAVIETHSWNWQAVSLVENQIDSLVKKNYGTTAKLEKTDKNGGKFFTWTAADERRVFAFAKDGLIYFGSDAAAIERCAAVKENQAESLMRDESFARAYSKNNLAFGYVSTAGISRIADLAGISLAVNASESDGERGFVARIVPPTLQKTTEEIVWTANRTERGIEDKYTVGLTNEANSALRESLDSVEPPPPNDLNRFLPPDIFSATRYNPRNPLNAWREVLSLTIRNTDALNGRILDKFSGRTLESYGIADAETFLSAVNAPIITARFDQEGEKSVTIAPIAEAEKLKKSIAHEIDFKRPPEKSAAAAEVWFSEDGNTAAAFVENVLLLGDRESVLKCLRAAQNPFPAAQNPAFQRFADSRSVAATFGKDVDSTALMVNLLSNSKFENRKLATFYTTETRLTAKGFERVTVSDYGLIGTILKNLD